MKNIGEDQEELRKIFQRFSGQIHSLTSLRGNLSVREFARVLNFLPKLARQISCGDIGFTSRELKNKKSERGILIFFREGENVIGPRASYCRLEKSLTSENESLFHRTISSECLMSAGEVHRFQAVDFTERKIVKSSRLKSTNFSSLKPSKDSPKFLKILSISAIILATIVVMKLLGNQ
jgi:hypothetical protein